MFEASSFFRRYAKKFGGSFESCGNDAIDTLNFTSIQSIKNCVIGITNTNPILKDIEYGYLCRDDFFAQAAYYEEKDIICFSASIPIKIFSLIKAAVTNGFANRISLNYPYKDKFSFDAKRPFSSYVDDPLVMRKTGDGNIDFALSCILAISTRFIGLHEFFHVAQGHTRWVKENLKISQITDGNDFDSGDENSSIIRQTLEWDADCSAIERLTLSTFNAIPAAAIEHTRYVIEPYGPFGVWQQAAYFEVISITICYFFLFSSEMKIEKITNHPEKVFRIRSSLYYITEMASRCRGINLDNFALIVFYAVEDAELIWKEFGDENLPISNLVEIVKFPDLDYFKLEDEIYRKTLRTCKQNGLVSLMQKAPWE